MADGAREESQRQRAGARGRRRSLTSQPFEALDEAAGDSDGNDAEPLAAAKHAARTAAAAAIAGGLVGAAKVLIQRRGRTNDEDEDEDKERKHGGDDRPGMSGDATEGQRARNSVTDEAEDDASEDAQRAAEEDDELQRVAYHEEPRTRDDADAPQRGASSSDVAAVVGRARSHVTDLLGKETESVSAISRANGSWSVTVEVVEVHRVPDSTDILSSYEVVVDDEGDLVRLERRGRYRRSQVEEDR